LTQMFAPGDHHDNSLLIPDWTLQWILCAADHWNLTADLETMDAIWPSIQKALSWFEGVAGPHGLIVDMIYWHFMDWAGLGRSDQALALNAQLAGAYRAAAVVGRAVGAERAAQTYEARATRMTTQLDADHWDEVRGVWVDMVEPRQGVQRPRVSQHGVAALTLWGNPDRDRVARACAWATDPERETWTAAPPVVPVSGGQPLDEDRGVVMANTFYGHFVGEALSRHGQRQVALANIRRRFEPMIAAGSTTLWEAMTPFASLCHGFSASPTYFLSRHVLGVSPAAPGFERIQFSPDLIDLEYAEGIVPAGDRDLRIFLERTDLGFDARIEGGGDAIDVVAAPGLVLTALQQSGDQITARFATAPVLAGKP
ncbi:MAG: MGH1-like glycoside hydrolase domain-containing protein, partial [Alphaproteobacteria bacterium]